MKVADKDLKRLLIFSSLGLLLISVLMIINILIGLQEVTIKDIYQAIIKTDKSKLDLIITTIRLPRAILGALVGGAFGMAGLIMQGITRNPLASPQVLGVNAGAALAVVVSIAFFPSIPKEAHFLFGFLGAIGSGVFVYGISSGNGFSPIKITLAGMALHMFLSSITQGIILLNENSTDILLFWLSGAIHQGQWEQVYLMIPWVLIGIVLCIYIAPGMDALQLGDEVFKSLGQSVTKIRLIGAGIVVILAGSSISSVGPIAFIGLVTPHLISVFSGHRYINKIILSAIYGGILLVLSDIISKILRFPYETPVGIVTAFLGAIFYLVLARTKVRRQGV